MSCTHQGYIAFVKLPCQPKAVHATQNSSVGHDSSPPSLQRTPFTSAHPLRFSSPPSLQLTPFASAHPLRFSSPPSLQLTPFASAHPLRFSSPPSLQLTPFASAHPLRFSSPPSLQLTPFASAHPLRFSSPPSLQRTPFASAHPLRFSAPPSLQRTPFASAHPLRFSSPPSLQLTPFASAHPLRFSSPPSLQLTPFTSVVSTARRAVRAPGACLRSSNHSMSCLTMDLKALRRSRLVRRSPATPRANACVNCKVPARTAMPRKAMEYTNPPLSTTLRSMLPKLCVGEGRTLNVKKWKSANVRHKQ